MHRSPAERRRAPVLLLAALAGLSLLAGIVWWSTTSGDATPDESGRADGSSERTRTSTQQATVPSAPLGDEFEGAVLDAATWSTCYHWQPDACTNEWNDELQAYHPANVRLADGALELTAREEPNTGHLAGGEGREFQYSSGMISGHAGQTFQYGFVEVRARVPAGQGLWPALWLLPEDLVWPPEIDIMELIGDEPEVVHQTLYAADGAPTRFRIEGDDYSEDWHTFAVDWRPGSLTFYVDGERQGHATEGIPDEPMYFIANLAVGGEWPGAPSAETELPATFAVDHVRIWPGTDGPPPGHPLHEPSR